MRSIKVSHNAEVAHRLSQLEGNKCQQVHGHSLNLTLAIEADGPVRTSGIVFEFGHVKEKLRAHVDAFYDHHLLLYMNDPLVLACENAKIELPGLEETVDDPSTENIARWLYTWAKMEFGSEYRYQVEVWETAVNCATHGDF